MRQSCDSVVSKMIPLTVLNDNDIETTDSCTAALIDSREKSECRVVIVTLDNWTINTLGTLQIPTDSSKAAFIDLK